MRLIFAISTFYIVINLRICSSYLLLKHTVPRYKSIHVPSSENVGEPLLLTPLLKSNQIKKARQYSTVPSLLKNANIESNAGYFTVNETYNSNIFFWFFRTTDTSVGWKKAPVLLWLQGGPGCSSLYGMFEENGPYIVTKNGKTRRRKYAWTNKYNVLYIDQPVGTGFSFTNSTKGLVNNQIQVADHLYEALRQFFQLYPELKSNKFYITGESYAGKNIPAIAYKIHKLKMAGKCNMNLQGLFIVSAFSDPINQMHYSEFLYNIGFIDDRGRDEISLMEKNVTSLTHSGFYGLATDELNDIFDKIDNVSQLQSFYDYTTLNISDIENYVKYVQSAEIRKKIHVGNATYDDVSYEVNGQFRIDFTGSVKPYIEELLEYYHIAFVGGQLDVITAYPLVNHVLQRLRWSGAKDYIQGKRKLMYDGNRVSGYSKVAGHLKDIMIRRAGHMVPGQQPRIALKVLGDFIAGKL